MSSTTRLVLLGFGTVGGGGAAWCAIFCWAVARVERMRPAMARRPPSDVELPLWPAAAAAAAAAAEEEEEEDDDDDDEERLSVLWEEEEPVEEIV